MHLLWFAVSRPFAKLQEAGSSTPLRSAQSYMDEAQRIEVLSASFICIASQ
jgi:hypothetical protein